MSVFSGVVLKVVATAGVLAATTAAQAQVLTLPLRVSGALVQTVSDVGGPGPYAAMPPVYDDVPPPRYGYAPAVLPPREIYAILREAGFSPLGMPQQRGLVYTVSALDQNGEDGRMVIDARSGRILRFMPAYRLGSRMDEETLSSYGPEGGLPLIRDDRRPPHVAGPKVASRTPSAVPLPKRAPVRAVATPTHPVAATTTKPVAVALPPTPPAAAPVQQSAVTEPKVIEAKPAETTGAAPAVAASAPAAAAPTVPAPATEAKPAEPSKPADTPAVQGLE